MLEKDWQAETRLLRQREGKARAILGVSATASRAELRRAFRRASLANHPDMNPADKDAERRFHLICCAYRCLTEGKSCPALDKLQGPPQAPTDTRYRLGNPWGYWCWWRDKYFDETK